jgi:maltose-binding protein MalE
VTRIISWKKLMLLAALLAMLIVAAVPAIAQIGQESEQESESGEVDQSFEVSSSGDNSNQCAGIQGVANTGNAQNQVDLIQYGSDADDFEFDEVGSTITVSPENSTTCDQQVNQAASASGDSPGTGGTTVKKK